MASHTKKVTRRRKMKKHTQGRQRKAEIRKSGGTTKSVTELFGE